MNLLTVRDVAGRLCFSRSKIYQMCRKGTLPSLKIDGAVRIDENDLVVYLEECRVVVKQRKQRCIRRPVLKHIKLT